MNTIVEEEYPGILQKLEWTICRVHDEYPSLTDYEVMRIFEKLITEYKYEASGREVIAKESTNQLDAKLYHALVSLCENYLGREDAVFKIKDGMEISVEQITVDELLLCLKRLLKSAKRWNKKDGRKGYLNLISQFVPVGT